MDGIGGQERTETPDIADAEDMISNGCVGKPGEPTGYGVLDAGAGLAVDPVSSSLALVTFG